MKVLHVIPSISSVRGGPSQAVLEMVKALIDRGIDAEIATTNDNGSDLLDVSLNQRICYQGVPIWFFPCFAPSSFKPLRELVISSQLTSWLWDEISNYDLLHVHAIFSYPSTVAMAIARMQKIPYIVRPLGQLCQWSLQQNSFKKQIYLKLIERANLDRARSFHFTSSQEQQEALELKLTSPSFILPHGLYLAPLLSDARQHLRQYLDIPENEPIILFLSRLHSKKGLDYLIEALGKLPNYPFTFVIAGNGSKDYEMHVDSLLLANGIQHRTRTVGFVTGKLKNLLIQGSDLFALTSYSENFGVAVLEALAASLPVLITPGVALADLVNSEKIGYIADLNVEAIASTLRFALDNPEQTKAMGHKASQIVLKHYTWDSIAKKMLTIYRSILEEQKDSNLQFQLEKI
jgi:glycosyltransferase involved in cell wall biosynthesis